MNTVSGEEKKEERKEREDQKKEKIESGKYRVKGGGLEGKDRERISVNL